MRQNRVWLWHVVAGGLVLIVAKLTNNSCYLETRVERFLSASPEVGTPLI